MHPSPFFQNIDEGYQRVIETKEEKVPIVWKLYIYRLDGNFIDLQEEAEKLLVSLKGQCLNDLPFINSYCSEKCTLKDVRCKRRYIDFQFAIERGFIQHKAGKPYKTIKIYKASVRYYLTKGIVIAEVEEDWMHPIILPILCLLPDYIQMRLSPSLRFKYHAPRYKSINLNENQLLLLELLLGGALKEGSSDGVGRNIEYIRVEEWFMGIEDPSLLLQTKKTRGKKRYTEFFKKDCSCNRKIHIDETGYITTNYLLNDDMMDSIVILLANIESLEKNRETFTITAPVLDEYLHAIHKGILEEAQIRQKKHIIQDLTELFDDAVGVRTDSAKLSLLFFILFFNRLLFLLRTIGEKKYDGEMDGFDYLFLFDFLKFYMKAYGEKEVGEMKLAGVVQHLKEMITDSKGEIDMWIQLTN